MADFSVDFCGCAVEWLHLESSVSQEFEWTFKRLVGSQGWFALFSFSHHKNRPVVLGEAARDTENASPQCFRLGHVKLTPELSLVGQKTGLIGESGGPDKHRYRTPPPPQNDPLDCPCYVACQKHCISPASSSIHVLKIIPWMQNWQNSWYVKRSHWTISLYLLWPEMVKLSPRLHIKFLLTPLVVGKSSWTDLISRYRCTWESSGPGLSPVEVAQSSHWLVTFDVLSYPRHVIWVTVYSLSWDNRA